MKALLSDRVPPDTVYEGSQRWTVSESGAEQFSLQQSGGRPRGVVLRDSVDSHRVQEVGGAISVEPEEWAIAQKCQAGLTL